MKKLNYPNILKFLLILFVLTMPLQNRDLFSFFGTRLFPSRLILVTLIFISAAYCLAKLLADRNILSQLPVFLKGLFKDSLLRILIILWIVRLISIKESLNIRASLSLMLFYSSMIALYLVLRYFRFREYKFLTRLFSVYVITVSIVGVFGFAQAFLSLFGIVLPGVLLGSTFIRIPSTFYDANHLPPYLLTALPSLLAFSFYEEGSKKRWLNYVLVAILSLVIFLTFSRSGIISFFVLVLVFLVYFIRNRYWKKLSFVLVVLSLIGFGVFISARTNFSFVKRAISIFDIRDKSTVAHGILLYGGFEVWQKNPILGVGYGGFSEAFRKTQLGREHAVYDPATQVRLPIHSIWLEALVETGVVGFVLYLSIMIIIIEKIIKVYRISRNPKIRFTVLTFLASVVSILVGGIFYSYNLEFFWFFLFFTYLFCDVLLKEKKEETLGYFEEKSERLNWGEIFPISFLVVLSFLLLTYNLSYPLLAAGNESFLAVLSKTIRRAWGMGLPYWWVPRFGFDGDFSKVKIA